MKSAESAGAHSGEVVGDCELAIWRDEIRQHALIGLARQPVKPPWIFRIGVLALLLIAHAMLVVGLRNAMRSPIAVDETAVEVQFLDSDFPEPPLPRPRVASRAAAIAPHATASPPAAAPAAARGDTVTQLQIFNSDGSIRVPAAPTPFASPKLQISAELMQRGHNLLHCRQTRFAGAYTRDESIGDEVARKYLVWIGLYNADSLERRAGQRQAEAAAACDG